MPVVERTPGTEIPSEITGIMDSGVMKNYIDHADFEHKMHSLTADVIYRYKTG